jgi:hypothetical protein
VRARFLAWMACVGVIERFAIDVLRMGRQVPLHRNRQVVIA